jgi:hypothetical protein
MRITTTITTSITTFTTTTITTSTTTTIVTGKCYSNWIDIVSYTV